MDDPPAASHLWFSRDNGSTWQHPNSPGQIHTRFGGGEGDIAVDARGRLYFVDMYTGFADVSFSRWRPGAAGPEWELTRPAMGTVAPDDRPWLDAHGDGILYYMGNAAVDLPAPNNPTDAPGQGSRMWFYVSTDAGVTWSPGHGFADTGWCNIAASPADDQSVAVVCSEPSVVRETVADLIGQTIEFRMRIHTSDDRGATWTHTDAGRRNGTLWAGGVGHPVVAYALDGSIHAAWIDAGADESSTRIMYLNWPRQGAAAIYDVTPAVGDYSRVWVGAVDRDSARLTYYVKTNSGDATWKPYAQFVEVEDGQPGKTGAILLDDRPAGKGELAPFDFFQNAIDRQGHLHVVYEREPGNIEYVREIGA